MDKVKKKKKKITGRPTKYTDDLANKICHAIANSSKGLSHLCKENEDFPVRSTIYEWIFNNKLFSDKYTRAKEMQAEFMVDEMLEISDDVALDSYVGDDGNVKPNNEYINRSRLRVDTRKWIISKVLPKVYGDKIVNEHTGKDGDDIKLDVKTKLSIDEINNRINLLIGT